MAATITGVINGKIVSAPESVITRLEKEDKTLDARAKAVKTFEHSKETTEPAPRNFTGKNAGKFSYSREWYEARIDARAEARNDLREKWGYLGEARSRKKVRVLDVTYVPEATFKAFETEQDTSRSRMLVELKEPWTDKRYMVNIADTIHREVGNCSKIRAERLKNVMPDYVRVVGGHIADADISAWLARANF